MRKKGQPEDADLSSSIGGTLNLLGLKLDLGKLLSSPEDLTSQLEGLRERLKDLGGKEALTDDDWKGGATSVSGYVRVRSLGGDEEYHIGTSGTSASRKPRSRPGRATESREVVEPPLDIFDEPDGVTIIADVPGVDSDDLKVSITGRQLLISPSPSARRAYRKEIELSMEIDPQSLKTSCRNGVLEIRLAKATGG